MSDNVNVSVNDSDSDYSEWPAEYVKGHPGFIFGSQVLAHHLRGVKKAGYDSVGEVANLWENSLRPVTSGSSTQRKKLVTPFSENHKAVVVTVLKESEGKGGKNSNDSNNGRQRSRLDDAYFKPMLVIEPQRPMRPTTSAEEAQRVWDLAFERRFKNVMIENRAELLRNSLHCALSVGLQVMFYYFDASKSDDDEALFTRLHQRPLNLEVVADQVEVERWLKHINEYMEAERDF